ncbi:MAG: DUF881 domain-containing protein [Fimbriimonadaceae bacterium]|nr:DUF881 domain-containing protein [Fimbriimonadaceae bacterium]QYK59503.1 MAG: DUF881 domain-containing protein [Fimbriimonadaceae bacterium]
MFNPFSSRKSENAWVVPVSVMAVVVGFMSSLAWITNDDRSRRLQSLSPELKQRYAAGELDLTDENEQLRSEVTKLRDDVTKLQNAVAENSNASQSLNKSLQEIKVFAGLTEIEGPGVIVTLRDSTSPADTVMNAVGPIIHDNDVLRVVNELRNAGAEALSVNNRRVGPNTNFRCVGTTIHVDEVKIASPVVIRAVGDPETLFGAMTMPGGVVSEIREYDPKMVEIKPVKSLRLPGYSGSTIFKVAKVPEDKK